MPGQSLRQRADTNARGGEVAQVDPAVMLRQKIRAMEGEFKLAMPRGVEAAQLVRDAITALSTNPKLAEVNAQSVLGALMTCAQLGLRPGVLGQAYVIPFKGRATVVIGYKGWLTLAHRSGHIEAIKARIVYERDEFDYEYGLNERLVHRPHRGPDRGQAVAYYCIVRVRGATDPMFEVLERAAAEEHRDKFAMQRDRDGRIKGPWVDHFDAMALKTAILKTLKLAPQDTELRTAIAADESFRVNLDPHADLVEVAHRDDDADTVDAELVDTDTGVIAEDPPAAEGWPEVAQPGGTT